MKYIRSFLTLLFAALLLAGCSSGNDDLEHTAASSATEEPVAEFDIQINGDCSTPVYEIEFLNQSSVADSYLWDFGDGTTSSLANPKKVYAKAGIYKIKLTAFYSRGERQMEKDITVIRNSDGTGPVADISFFRSNATSLELDLQTKSEASDYSWSFGDGTSASSDKSEIVHTYAGVGKYDVQLVLRNDDGATCVTTEVDTHP